MSGDVVVVPFPFTNLDENKRRPALVLADVGLGDYILCQITSKDWHEPAIELEETDFVEGGLGRTSFVRPDRVFTVMGETIAYRAGQISADRLEESRKTLIDALG